MAKRVRLSADSGTTWYTLPGNSGEFNAEAGDLNDTIFGQDYQSSQTGAISWTIQANALYKGFPGYVVTIKKPGVSTTMTASPMSLVSGKTYKITDATKNVWDRSTPVTVLDNAVAVSASNIESVDYLFGRVTFKSSYTPTGSITVTGKYFPMVTVGCTNTYTLTQTCNTIDTSCTDTVAANGGVRTYDYGLKTVSLDLEGIYKSANGFRALLLARTELVIEINPDGAGKSIARGFFKPMTTGTSGDVGDLEQEKITFGLSVPDMTAPDLTYPFHWIHTGTTLNMGVQIAIDAWQNKTTIDAQYLEDGTTGVTGDVIVTDVTLTGGLEAMNEFTVNMQGSGAWTSVP